MKHILVAILAASLLFSSCQKERFTTESEWLSPLLKTSLGINNLLTDSIVKTNSDNSVDLVYDYAYQLGDLTDIMNVPDKLEEMEVSLSSLVLEDRTFTDTLTLLEIYPQSLLLNGKMADLPAQDITTSQGTVIDVTEQFFKTAKFVEGYIDIEISNDLPVEAEIIEFELLNEVDKSVILNGVINNLLPYSTDKSSYSLAGKTVNGVLELRVKRIKTKASPAPVLIDVTKGLRTTFVVRDLKPETATAIFPAQNLVDRKDETAYDFGGAEITQLKVKTGVIQIFVESSIAEDIVLSYKIPNSSREGQAGPIQKVWKIPAASPGEKVVFEDRFPVDNFNIFLWGQSKFTYPIVNHIYNEFVARIEYSGIERTLSLNDKVKISFGLVDVLPSLVFGDPGYHKISLQDTFDLKAFRNIGGSINLEKVKLDLDFVNTFGIQTQVAVTNLKGVNTRTNKAVSLVSSQLSTPILIDKVSNQYKEVPIEKNVSLDNSNSNLKLFLENLPDKIIIDAFGVVRPNGTVDLTDFATDESRLSLNLKIQTPFNVGLNGLSLKIDEDVSLFKNENAENVKECVFTLRLANDFPFSGIVKLVFSDEQGNEILELFSDTAALMTAAEVDPLTERSISPSQNEIVTTVSRVNMANLQNASQVMVYVRLDTKDAKRYKMFADYKVGVQLMAQVVYASKL
jgi:hypothetical protein